jgi:hypothetical protein
MDRRGRPRAPAAAGGPGSGVQALEDLADRPLFLNQPALEGTDQGGFGLLDDEVAGAAVPFGNGAIALGRFAAQGMPRPGLREFAAPKAGTEHRPFVLGDGPLNLEEELVRRGIREGAVEKDELAAQATELLQEEDLRGILTGQAVRPPPGPELKGPFAGGITQPIQARPVEPGATVALSAVDLLREQLRPLALGPRPQGGELTVEGLVALLAVGGNAGINSDTPGIPPSGVLPLWAALVLRPA